MNFDARADSARSIIAKVQLDAVPNINSLHETVTIADTMARYSVTWTNAVPEQQTYKAGLFPGADTNDVWIDNIGLLAGPVTYCSLSTSAENGSISLDPAGGFYPNGTIVMVVAIPDSDYEFIGWSGALSGSNNPDSITIVSEISLTAIFTEVTGVVDEAGINLPEKTEIVQNYPNPFNPETTTPYRLPKPAQVKLTIFNTLGQKVSTLVNRKQPADYLLGKMAWKKSYGQTNGQRCLLISAGDS